MEEEKIRTAIAHNIAELRKKAGLTQSALGERLGYSDKSVSKWERAEGIPDAVVLAQMAELFGCSVDALMGLTPAPAPAAAETRRKTKRKMVPALSVLLVWLTAAVAYFVLALLPHPIPRAWLAFIYAVPVSFIVLTVFWRMWFTPLFQCLAVSGIIWGAAVSLKLSFPQSAMNLLFVIAGILQALAILWFFMRSKTKK